MTPAGRTTAQEAPTYAEMILTAHFQHIWPCDGEPCSCHFFEDLAVIRKALATPAPAEPHAHALYDCGGKGHGSDATEVRWCHDCTPHVPASRARDCGRRWNEARRAIQEEIDAASDPEGKDQFEKGALAAYHFALSALQQPKGGEE